jgi:hypothetical protein
MPWCIDQNWGEAPELPYRAAAPLLSPTLVILLYLEVRAANAHQHTRKRNLS